MKQGISDSDHAALIAGAYKFPKLPKPTPDQAEYLANILNERPDPNTMVGGPNPTRELGLIDNTEMGALNPMSLAEVQNIREHQMKRIVNLESLAALNEQAVADAPDAEMAQEGRELAAMFRQRAHAIRVQLAIEERYQEQTK